MWLTKYDQFDLEKHTVVYYCHTKRSYFVLARLYSALLCKFANNTKAELMLKIRTTAVCMLTLTAKGKQEAPDSAAVVKNY